MDTAGLILPPARLGHRLRLMALDAVKFQCLDARVTGVEECRVLTELLG
jgi:hypothetical protein